MKYNIFVFFIMFLIISFKSFSQNEPDWFLNPPEDFNYFYCAKTATSNSKQAALDKAIILAKADLCRHIEYKFHSLQKRIDEEINLSGDDSGLLSLFNIIISIVRTEVCINSIVEKEHFKKEGNNWRAFVLVSYPVGAATQSFVYWIKEEEEAYAKFKASQTFKEMEKEAEKYKQWQKQQKIK